MALDTTAGRDGVIDTAVDMKTSIVHVVAIFLTTSGGSS